MTRMAAWIRGAMAALVALLLVVGPGQPIAASIFDAGCPHAHLAAASSGAVLSADQGASDHRRHEHGAGPCATACCTSSPCASLIPPSGETVPAAVPPFEVPFRMARASLPPGVDRSPALPPPRIDA